MNPALAAITAVVVGGAVVAVTARDARATLLGLLIVLLGSAVLADPLPGALPIAARMVAAFLACRLIAVAIRGESVVTSGSRLGWPVEVLGAVGAAIVGFGTHGLGAAPTGPVAAQAAGFAVGALAVAPIVSGRDVLRLGIGAMLLLVGASLVRVGLAGTPSELEQLVTSGLVIGLGGAVAIIVAGSRASTGSLEISAEVARRLAFDSAAARDLLRPPAGSSIHLGRDAREARPEARDARPDTREAREARPEARPTEPTLGATSEPITDREPTSDREPRTGRPPRTSRPPGTGRRPDRRPPADRRNRPDDR